MENQLTVESIREKIADTVLEFLSNNKRHLVLKTFTGSGKTTTTLQTAAKSGHVFIYAAPSHDIIAENIKRSPYYNFDYLHLEGRDRLCKNPDYRELAKQGLDIHSFCQNCQFKIDDVCEYEKNIKRAYKDRPNLAITHAHINTWLPQFLNTDVDDTHKISDYYDVLIIDENPFKCFLNELQLTLQDIILFRERCIQLNMDREIIEITEALLIPPINYSRLEAVPLLDLDRKQVTHKYTERLANLYIENGVREIPKNILPFLFEIYEQMSNNNPIEQMIYYKDGIINLCYFKSNALDLAGGRLKILGLDGTASNIVWDSMLKTKVDIFPIDYEYKKGTVFQLNGGRYPIMSWRYDGPIPANLCKLIDMIAAQKRRNVLIVGTSYVNHKIASLIKCKNREFAMYYSLRSKNGFYINCDTVILTCEPNPPPEKIQSSVVLSGWPHEVWKRIYTQEEMLQAVGRLRQNIKVIKVEGCEPIQREEMMVYIFPSTDVDRKLFRSGLLPESVVLSKRNLYMWLSEPKYCFEHYLFQNRILESLPTSIKVFAKSVGISYGIAREYFISLLKQKYIEEDKRGHYKITEEGNAKLAKAAQDSSRVNRIVYSPQ